jgi:GAF domain-containing protein
MDREGHLVRTLVELADVFVEPFDVLGLLTERCVEIFGVAAAGIILASAEGHLGVMSSSNEDLRNLELLELQIQEGPCLDCFHSGVAVIEDDLTTAGDRWPHISVTILAVGYRSVHALPMRLRDTTIGALNLFRTDKGAMDEADVAAAQGFADVATVAIFQQRATNEAQLANDQLRYVMNSRIVVEQAIAVLAEGVSANTENAFTLLRRYAQMHNLRLIEIAQDLVEGRLTTNAFQPPSR